MERLLEGDGTNRAALEARDTLWAQVQDYVAYRARLRIGPLNDDEDVRRDIAVSALERLERDEHRCLREWLKRQRERRDGAPWWSFVRAIVKNCATDVARASRHNVARRGEPYQWNFPVLLEPHVLEAGADFLRRASHDERVAHLTLLQAAWRDDEQPPDPPRIDPRPRAPRAGFRTRRRTSDH